jgi:hypothetical protein
MFTAYRSHEVASKRVLRIEYQKPEIKSAYLQASTSQCFRRVSARVSLAHISPLKYIRIDILHRLAVCTPVWTPPVPSRAGPVPY